MSNFDLDSYLFGDIADDKPEEKEPKTEKEEKREEKDIGQEKHTEKTKDYEKIHPKDLSMAQQKSDSNTLVYDKEEREIKQEEGEEIEIGQSYEDDLPMWEETKPSEPSREDIIKGINFSDNNIKKTLKNQDYSQDDKYESNIKQKDVSPIEDVKESEEKKQTEPQEIKIKDDSLSTPQVKPEGVDSEPKDTSPTTTPTPTPPPPPPEKPKIQESKSKNPEKPQKAKRSKMFFLRILIYFLLFVILCLLLVFAYLNRDSFSQLGEDLDSVESSLEIEEEIPEIISERELIEQNRDDLSINDELDTTIQNILNEDYKVLTTGGFALLYTEIEDGEEIGYEVEMTFGNGESQAYFQEGLLTYIRIDEDDIVVVWDEDHNKYIISEAKEEYMMITEDSHEKYRDFLGQHILQDLIYEYLKQKSNMEKLGPEAWIWDWSFHTPINDYRTRNILNSVIIVDEETNFIEEIKLYDSDKKIGEYYFEFEELEEKDHFDLEILEEYTLVEKLEINY